MRNAKGFSLIMIFLLLFQIAHSGLSFMAAAEGKQGIYQDSTKLLVENKSYDENSITWQVVINEAKQATEELSTTITFNNGQTHGSIEDSDDVDIEKTNQGYEITTPASQQTHKITLTTEITNNEQTEFNLLAETEFKDETIIAEETVEIVKEDSTAKEEFEQEAKTEEESTEEKSGDGEKDQATAEEPVKKDKGESNDNEHVNEDITDEVVEESHISFITPSVSTASPGVKSSSNWPSPGSLNLEKEEKSTSNFAEWEIELEVEGKDLQTSSDIVLVFDKSGSMNDRGRLPKAKQAAIDFTNIVLGEGSNARIALVEFSGEATMTQNFTGHQNKNILINRINSIRATGGTNIHAGLHQAKLLLNESDAEHKTIVLLSDGEPTYSLKAGGYEQPYSWPGNRYDFLLKDFDYSTRIGNGVVGNRPDYGWNRYRCGGIIFPRYCYDPHVNDHVIPTISEAKHIMDSGIDIFSVGLEVGNVQDAIYTLENSQNKGFYSGSEDDMEEIFEKIAASLTYAATEAVVTDPLGEMFDLVKDGSYNGENFEASHGIATWDESTETFEWDIGSIKEGETYTLKYKVTFDCEKDPEVNTKYPTNKETTMSYKDYTGSNATKNFPIPKVQIDEAQIKRVGYRVNVDGEPIDENGDVVSSWQDAKQFYDDIVTGLQPNQNHEIDAGDTPGGYVLHQDFTDPAIVNVANLVCNLALFGYVKESELPAGTVTATYVDEAGETIAPSETFTGNMGDSYTTEEKVIQGYEFIKMGDGSADPTGTFTSADQTVIYVYKKLTGTIKVIKVDEHDSTKYLADAQFDIKDSDGKIVGELETNQDGEAVSEPLPIGEYTLVETKAPYGYELSEDQNMTVTVEAGEEAQVFITNKQLKGSLKIIKVDADNEEELLPDAIFELVDENNNKVSGTTDAQGEIVFDDLAIGTYTLKETKAPEGYRLLQKPIDVEITPDNLEITKTIKNSEQDWKIPKTGGIGTLGFYGVGLILMGIALWFVLRRKYI